MVIIVTGDIKIGKTTVCKKVLEIAHNSGYSCSGFITYKMPGESLSIKNIRTGEMATLAIPGDRFGGPLVPRFTFDPQGIDFGIRAMEEANSADILFVDEIGIIETMGEGFIKAFDFVNKRRDKTSILVIREELLEYLLPGLDEEPLVFKTTEENRDQLPHDIFASIIRGRSHP
ncbi:MAG TPA: nucleoside-triphosphatase [Candidatus Limnocylindrales bacterium]|nr:nucleoside-triphosphatase [Candidatus Limnocylindrales bacterium]